MFKNYLKTAFRNILKYKGYSLINIIGLAIGIACCIMIMLFVQDELSYDRYHENSDRMYRVGMDAVLNNSAIKSAVSCAPLATELTHTFPEVEAVVRVRNFGFPVFRYQDKVFSEEKVFWTDSTFFDVFTAKFLMGDPKTALNTPNKLVLTKSMARKYFGDENPMGKQINADFRNDYVVTGVIEDPPSNTHFHYEFLASLYQYNPDQDIQWVSNNYYTYLILQDGISVQDFEAKLFETTKQKVDPQIRAALGISVEEFFAAGGVYNYFINPVQDIHLHSHLENEVETNGSFAYVLIFSIIAFGILVVACINFVNLSTARAANRAKEVGIRKTVGSTRGQLILQFLTEAVLMSFYAMFIALVIVQLLLPSFNMLAGKQLVLSLFNSPLAMLLVIGMILFIGVLAGTYPALFLASFQPASVMKGEKIKGGRRAVMRNILVVFQFSISIILIISTLIVRRQVEYIQHTDLGFNKDNLVVVEKTDDLADRFDSFKLRLEENSGIVSVSNSYNLFAAGLGNSVMQMVGERSEENHLLWIINTDADFDDTYEIKMAEGRFFEENREADQLGCVINESAVRALSIEDPVGKQLTFPGGNNPVFQIMGIVKDFHFESLHTKIRPLIILPKRPGTTGRYTTVRIRPEGVQSTLRFIENTWRDVANNQSFEYVFFDDHFGEIYKSEKQTANIFFTFSILAVIIASLGLFGLAAFIAEQRTKEIGIRKVMGATVTGISSLLIRQFIKWVLIANVIAWPVAWYIMRQWLQNFAYQSSLSLWIFLLSAALALAIAIITVSYQSIKAAVADPVNSLRYE